MLELEVNGKRERIRAGLHICQLYTQPVETVHAAAPFVCDGLRHGDYCWVAVAPEQHVDLQTLIQEERLDMDHAVAKGQLLLETEKDLHTAQDTGFTLFVFMCVVVFGMTLGNEVFVWSTGGRHLYAIFLSHP